MQDQHPPREGDQTPDRDARPGPSGNFAALFDGPLDHASAEDDEPSAPPQREAD